MKIRGPKRDYPKDQLIHGLIAAQACRTPDHVAVVFQDREISYFELMSQASAITHALRQSGVRPGDLVGICLERSAHTIACILGVLRVGGVYLPLDPQYPLNRLQFMLDDSNARYLLCDPDCRFAASVAPQVAVIYASVAIEETTVDGRRHAAAFSSFGSDSPAYCLYTSGSTGNPKGALISHNAICNHMFWMLEQFEYNSTDVFLQRTPISFDASVWELFAPLLVGATLVVADEEHQTNVHALVDLICGQEITVLQLVPTILNYLMDCPTFSECRCLRLVFCGGEPLRSHMVNRFYELLNADLVNLYGPTEACIDSTFYRCDRGCTESIVPIGQPIANTQILILDESELLPVSSGDIGEICISGAGLANGYLNRPEMTTMKFVVIQAEDGEPTRIYRTGDLGRVRPDNAIEFLGRIDNQIKMRGIRIELDEIEIQLMGHPSVTAAVVVKQEKPDGEPLLAAHLICRATETPSIFELRTYLESRLPAYMIPARFLFLASYPTTPNGKIDRKILSSQLIVSADIELRQPRNDTEVVMKTIWEDILLVDNVGIDSNFLTLGGHSLLGAAMVRRVKRELGADIALADLYEKPTIADLSPIVAEQSQRDDNRFDVTLDLLAKIEHMTDDEVSAELLRTIEE